MLKNIVFVCTGNICRSPLAEYLFQHQTKENPDKVSISSAGTHALINHPMSQHSAALLKMENIDCEKHQARQLTSEIIHNADLILVMEKFHQYTINSSYVESRGKVFLLGHWEATEIPDPYQKDFSFYKKTAQMITQGLMSWGRKLQGL